MSMSEPRIENCGIVQGQEIGEKRCELVVNTQQSSDFVSLPNENLTLFDPDFLLHLSPIDSLVWGPT